MKNVKVTRIVSLLAILCLITTCFVGTTLAKYITTGDAATDSARVAEWGVKVNPTSDSAFKTTYDKDGDGTIAVTVDAEENVVAPGTGGTLADVGLTGAPEVAVEVSYAAELTLSNWTVEGADYCPIVFTVEDTEIKMDDTITTVAALEEAVEKAIVDLKKEYAANTDLSTVGEDAPTIKWAWAFEGENVKDTALGDAAVDGTAATIALSVTTTVTQLD